MTRIIIYTAVIGGYDLLPKVREEEGIDYYCFTDAVPANTNGWTCVHTPSFFTDKKLVTGYLKTNAHLLFPTDSIVVWIDSNLDSVELTKSEILQYIHGQAICTLFHPTRKMVFGEISIVSEYSLDNRNRTARWEEELKSIGYPDNNGLAQTNFLIRDLRNPRVRNFNEVWWKFLVGGSRRDQLSFNPALWYVNLDWKGLWVSEEEAGRNGFFKSPFKEHFNPLSRIVPNHIPAHKVEEYAPFCWVEFSPTVQPDGSIAQYYFFESERWLAPVLEFIRSINKLSVDLKVPIKDNYWFVERDQITEASVPDPRFAWKREYLRKSVLPSQWGLEVGFGHGYSSALMLGHCPSLSIVAIESSPDTLTYKSAEVFANVFGGRFQLHCDGPGKVLSELSQQRFPLNKLEFIHYNSYGIYDADEYWMTMEWYLCHAPEGCRLIFAEGNRQIDSTVKLFQTLNVMKPLNPGLPEVGGNSQYIKLSNLSVEEFRKLRDVCFSFYKNEKDLYGLANHKINELAESKIKLSADYEKIIGEYENLLDYTRRLEKYTRRMERPGYYFHIKTLRFLGKILHRKSKKEDVDSILEKR